MANNEKTHTHAPEQSPDVEQFGELAHERREAMRVQLERNERRQKKLEDQDSLIDTAASLAKEADRGYTKQHEHKSNERSHRGAPSKKQREHAFKKKIESVQSEMSPSERTMSKVLHVRPVEKTSDFIGSTIARPNAMLSGSIAAFIGVTAVYFTAKYFGFQLSGFETIAAFVIGWIIGIAYDYASFTLRKRDR